MERLDGNGSLHQLSPCRDDEVLVPEAYMSTHDLADAMTSHLRPDVDVETRKKPLPGSPTVGVFGPPTSKFVFMSLARIVCSEDIRVYTSSGGTSLHPVRYCSCYRHLVCSRGYK